MEQRVAIVTGIGKLVDIKNPDIEFGDKHATNHRADKSPRHL